MIVIHSRSADVLVRFILSKIDLEHHAIFSTGEDVRAGDRIDGELQEGRRHPERIIDLKGAYLMSGG